MSPDLGAKVLLGLDELESIKGQLIILASLPPDRQGGDMERAVAASFLHSFYTEIEKIMKMIAKEWDGEMPSSDSWHRDLLHQMAAATSRRPAVVIRCPSRRSRHVPRVPSSVSRRFDPVDAMG